jgi:uncharacterized membrane protein YheB (UPF0754 family)
LDGKKRPQRPNTKITVQENFPLRGFLTCPNCGKTLTASASRGRNNRYFYYHCNSTCGFRERAELVNKVFVDGLMTLEMNEPIKKYLKKLLTENYKNFIDDPLKEKNKISNEINTLNNKLSFARNKFFSEIIDDNEYLEIKREYKERISKLEEDLNKSSVPQIINVDKHSNKP